MKLLTTLLSRTKTAEFINTEEGRKAFENAQRDIITLYPVLSYLVDDESNNTNTFKNSKLSVEVENGKVYFVEAVLTFQSDTLNAGIGIGFNLPSNVDISFQWLHNHTVKSFEGGYNIASGTVSGDTNEVPAINSNIPLTGFGIIKANNTGVVTLQYRSETTNTITLKGGLCGLRLTQIE